MNYSKSAKIGFVLSLLVLVPAVFHVLVSYIHGLDSTIFGVIAYGLIFCATVPEVLAGEIMSRLGFPVVMPLIALIVSLVGLQSSQKKLLPVLSIIFVGAGISLWILLRLVPPAVYPFGP